MSKHMIECLCMRVCAFTLTAYLPWVCLCVEAMWPWASSCIAADCIAWAKDCVINTGKRLNRFLTYPRRGHPGWAVVTCRLGL